MLDLVLEIIGQLVFEVAVNVLFELGFRGLGVALQSRAGRLAICALIGVGVGLLWGDHLADRGTTHRTALFWLSLALGGIAAVLAVINHWRSEQIEAATAPGALIRSVVTPWRWPPSRLAGFALLSLALALGIDLGFASGRLR